MDRIAQAYSGLGEKVRGIFSGIPRSDSAAQNAKQLYVDSPENQVQVGNHKEKYRKTLASLEKHCRSRDERALESDISNAVKESMGLLRSTGWNTWKFDAPYAEVLRFGVVLDWPQYENHLSEQMNLLRQVCDKIGGTHMLESCGTKTAVAGGAHALYLGFKPSGMQEK